MKQLVSLLREHLQLFVFAPHVVEKPPGVPHRSQNVVFSTHYQKGISELSLLIVVFNDASQLTQRTEGHEWKAPND